MNSSIRMSSGYQRAVSDFVSQNVICCLSRMIMEVSENSEELAEEIRDAGIDRQQDYKQAGIEEGYSVTSLNEESDWFALKTRDLEKLVIFFIDTATAATENDCVEIREGGRGYYWRLEDPTKVRYDDDGSAFFSEDDARRHAYEELGSYLSRAEDEDEAWVALCDDEGIEAIEIEALEHWGVTGYLARKLVERGEMVGQFMGFEIWGRGTSGQAISIDEVICDIFDEANPNFKDPFAAPQLYNFVGYHWDQSNDVVKIIQFRSESRTNPLGVDEELATRLVEGYDSESHHFQVEEFNPEAPILR